MSFWDRFKKKKEEKKEPKQTNNVLALKNKSPFAWTIEDVGNWLKYIGFPEYVTLFQENQIAGDVLFSLDIVDLKSMGVSVLGHRKKMMQEITTLVPENKNRSTSEKESEESDKDSRESKESSSKESSSISATSSKALNDPNYLKVICVFDSDEVPFICKKSYTFKKIQNKFEEAFGINGLRIYHNGKEIVEDRIWENLAQQNSEIKFEVKRGDPNQITTTERNVLEQILDAAFIINTKGVILYGNRAIKKHLGYSRKQLIGKNISSIMPKEHSSKHDGYLEKYLSSGKSTVIGKGRQMQVVLNNGEEKLCWLAVTENKTKHGRHTFTGTIHLLQETRSEEMNSYRILDCLRKSIFVIDTEGNVQFVNRSAEALLGYKTEELLAQNINKIMPEPYASRHNGYLLNYLKVGKSQIIGTKGRLVAAKASNGSLVPILLEVNEVIIDNKRYFVGVMTKQEKIEKQKSTLEETRDVLSSLLVPAVIIDKEGIIQAINEDATDMLGYELVDVVGQNVNILMNDSDSKKHDSYLQQYYKTGETSVIGKKRKVVAKTKDGKLKAVVLSVTERGSGDDIIFLGILLPV